MEKEKVLSRVRALLDRADHPNTPAPEADACRLKADELMLAYAIETFELPDADGKVRAKPVLREYRYGTAGDNEADDELARMFYSMAKHCGVEVGLYGWRFSKIVGYESDLDYLDLLFTNVRMELSSKIVIRPDPRKDLGENVALFKAAGYKWIDIYNELLRAEMVPPYSNGRSWRAQQDGGIILRAYKKWLKAHPGEEHIGANPRSYRYGFIKGFSDEILMRLYRMTRNRSQKVEEKGYGIVLANRADELKEELYKHFPHLRPHEAGCQCDACTGKGKRRVAKYRERGYSEAAYGKGRDAGSTVNLSMGRHGLDRKREISQGG